MKRRPMIARLGSGGAFPITLFLALGGPRQAQVQAAQEPEETSCTVFCTPELNFEPTLSLNDLIAAPWVEDVATGQRRRLGVDPVFQATLSLGIPTELPYVELTLETIFTPFVDDTPWSSKPSSISSFFRKEWTAGWVGAHFDIIDQLSPRARPGGGRTYTHKLDLELDVALYVFNWVTPPSWLHDVSVEASFDYLATGLPRRGDVIDGERYLDDASGWSLSLLVVLPLAPLER